MEEESKRAHEVYKDVMDFMKSKLEEEKEVKGKVEVCTGIMAASIHALGNVGTILRKAPQEYMDLIVHLVTKKMIENVLSIVRSN